MITDAIRDENVLKFSVEYYKGFRFKDGRDDIDVDVEAIDIQEAMESPLRLEAITDFVIANHDRKTHSREFTAIMAVSSVDVLTKYYELFRRKNRWANTTCVLPRYLATAQMKTTKTPTACSMMTRS